MLNLQEKAENFAQALWGDRFDATPEHIQNGVIFGYELCQKEYEEKLRWIPVEEELKPKKRFKKIRKQFFYICFSQRYSWGSSISLLQLQKERLLFKCVFRT